MNVTKQMTAAKIRWREVDVALGSSLGTPFVIWQQVPEVTVLSNYFRN